MCEKQRGQKIRRRFKPSSATFLFLLMFALVLFNINLGTALEFDNVLSDYDEATRTATFENAFGLGAVIGQVQLKTPLNFEVARGYNYVWEIEAWVNEDYNDFLKGLEYLDLGTNQGANRNMDVKMLSYENVEVDDFELQNVGEENGTAIYDYVVVGSHMEMEQVWTKVTPADLKNADGVVTLRGYTEVEKGDKIDWSAEFFGARIGHEVWAVWTESLNVDLEFYAKLDEAAGSVIDSVNGNDGTNNGASALATGQLGTSYTFAPNDYIEFADTDDLDIATEISFGAWIYPTAHSSKFIIKHAQDTWAFPYADWAFGLDGDYKLSGWVNSNANQQISDDAVTANDWNFVVFTFDGTNQRMYIDGVASGVYAQTAAIATSDKPLWLGGRVGPGEMYAGNIDEVFIYSRVLSQSEITDLYNSNVGITWTDDFGAVPTVTLTSPIDEGNLTSQSVELIVEVTDESQVDNVTLYLDGVANETNSSQINGTYTFSKSVTEGNHTWHIVAIDNDSLSTQSSNRTFTVHLIAPNVSVSAPSGQLDFIEFGGNVTMTYNVSEPGQDLETHMDSCWYVYNDSENSLNCSATEINFSYIPGQNNLTIYVNDTFGFQANDSTSWSYIMAETAWSFPSPTLEGAIDDIILNATINNTLRVSTILLIYNETQSSATYTNPTGNEYVITTEHTAPGVPAATNLTFYYKIVYEDDSFSTSSNQTQLVNDLGIDNCSSYTNMLFNFTIADEATQAVLNGSGDNTSLKMDFSLFDKNGVNEVISLSQFFDKENPAAVCIKESLGESEYLASGIIEYSSADRFVEFYNIQNYTLTTATANQNITLYNLKEDGGQEFKVIYKGQDFIPVTDLIIQIQRKYIDEGVYKVIEIPASGSNGYTVAHLVPNDVIYNLIFIKAGEVLDTFTEVIATCQNPTITECEINLNALITGTNLQEIIADDEFFTSLSYDKDSKVVTATYGILSGVSSNVILNVTLLDNFGDNLVCSDSLFAAGGTLTCSVPTAFGNSSIYAAVIYNDEIRSEGYIKQNQSPQEQFGGVLILGSIILLLFMFGMGISDNPAITGIFLILGAIMLVGLNLVYSTSIFGAGATVLWFIVAVLIVIIKGGGKR